METCTYGLGADIWKPTTERWQGAEYRAYWYNGTPYLISSSPTRRRRAGEKFFLGTEIHGFIFNKGTAWLRIDIYPRHCVITACFASSRLSFPLSFFVHRLAQINTDFLISKDIVIITDYYNFLSNHGISFR